jgi:hypothetical protein
MLEQINNYDESHFILVSVSVPVPIPVIGE